MGAIAMPPTGACAQHHTLLALLSAKPHDGVRNRR